MKVEEKIALDAIKNDCESHIRLDQKICSACKERMCVLVCPGHLYSLNEETGDMVVEYAGCLECGSCSIACSYKAVAWNYPRGGFGVQYRYG
ncbi:MAG: 4Fe-4S dicluster domain-containing protein [Syntrophales bacterium]|nr:4Fe-4S dicluster domain-containing protein [Syntrophales bacterium]